jgi:hypothetical protein
MMNTNYPPLQSDPMTSNPFICILFRVESKRQRDAPSSDNLFSSSFGPIDRPTERRFSSPLPPPRFSCKQDVAWGLE